MAYKKYSPGNRLGEMVILDVAGKNMYLVKCGKCGGEYTYTTNKIFAEQMDIYGCLNCQGKNKDKRTPNHKHIKFLSKIAGLRRDYIGKIISGVQIDNVVVDEHLDNRGVIRKYVFFTGKCQICGNPAKVMVDTLLKRDNSIEGCPSCAHRKHK